MKDSAFSNYKKSANIPYFFSEEAYKARMAAYMKGIRKYRLKEAAETESKKKTVGIGGSAL